MICDMSLAKVRIDFGEESVEEERCNKRAEGAALDEAFLLAQEGAKGAVRLAAQVPKALSGSRHQRAFGFAQRRSNREMSGRKWLAHSKTDQRASWEMALNTLVMSGMTRAWVGDDGFNWRSIMSAIVEWMMKSAPLGCQF